MSRASAPTVLIEGYHLGESSKAVKFGIHQINGQPLAETKTEWFPFSQVSKIYQAKGAEFDSLTCSDWICKTKGLI